MAVKRRAVSGGIESGEEGEAAGRRPSLEGGRLAKAARDLS